ncbi:MAG TPA: molybdenum cofactor biosynthesis protein MoaE [Candidatus Azoamicus sp.]
MLKKYCISIKKNNNKTNIYINQFSGIAEVGKINLIIAIQSTNRKNAFLICHKLLEFIKNNAPIWKKETYIDGTSKWINA